MKLPTPRLRPALFQLLLFLMLAVNIECFCWLRLHQIGVESNGANAQHDPRTGWKMVVGNGRHNSDGLRGDELPSGENPNGELRILTLGGSVTYGLSLDESLAYPMQLQTALRTTHPNLRVINAGTPGYSTFEMLGLLTQIAPKCTPNVLTVMVGFNDSMVTAYRDREPEMAKGIFRAHQMADEARGLLYKSATYRYLTYLLKPPAAPQLTASNMREAIIQSSVDNVRLMKYYADLHGMKLVVMMEAHRRRSLPAETAGIGAVTQNMKLYKREEYLTFLDDLSQAQAASAKALGVPFLDMSDVLVASKSDEDVFFLPADPIHLTPAGGRIEAEALARLLEQNDLLH